MNDHERRYHSLRRLVDARLRSLIKERSPKEINEACRYVLDAGGKRIRPVLLLLSCEAVGGNFRTALDAGAAMEIVHNFTLVHDDVMDHASSRRGRATVHTKWNLNTALLSGDILLAHAYRQILKTKSDRMQRLLDVFTDGFLTVCEGQALDLEFEYRGDITLRDYFTMIEKKTGRLIAASTQLGGTIGGGTEKQITSLKKFGHYLGRAFQLQDDVLDVVADEKEFGKRIGGDILEGKKTFLLLKSLERSRGKEKARLMRVMNRRSEKPLRSRMERDNEVRSVTAIYESTGAIAEARMRIAADTRAAVAALHVLPNTDAREHLLWLAEMLLTRNF